MRTLPYVVRTGMYCTLQYVPERLTSIYSDDSVLVRLFLRNSYVRSTPVVSPAMLLLYV